jgi:hypothetical protein
MVAMLRTIRIDQDHQDSQCHGWKIRSFSVNDRLCSRNPCSGFLETYVISYCCHTAAPIVNVALCSNLILILSLTLIADDPNFCADKEKSNENIEVQSEDTTKYISQDLYPVSHQIYLTDCMQIQ